MTIVWLPVLASLCYGIAMVFRKGGLGQRDRCGDRGRGHGQLGLAGELRRANRLSMRNSHNEGIKE
jgi:hypothetical protein